MNFSKPFFWDQKSPSIFSYLLLPFTLLIMLSNLIIKKTKKYKNNKIFSICVGNIYLGGTGKTPTVIKLYNEIKKINKNVIIGKKNYSKHIDEIKILKRKTELITGTDRKKIMNKASEKRKKIIIFDDGLQDKKVDYDLKFVCFDTSNWIGNGRLIPSGPLREKLNQIIKFDAVFLKNISKKNNLIIKKIKKIKPNIKIYNSTYIIKDLYKYDVKKNYIAFSGIGNPLSFKKILKFNGFKVFENISFPDHYNYKIKDVKKILSKAHKKNFDIITTEKDYVKIPTKYKKFIKYVELDLIIDKQKKLMAFIKSRLNA